jgi:hypothetical protein
VPSIFATASLVAKRVARRWTRSAQNPISAGVQQAEAAHAGSRWEKSVVQSETGLVTILLRVPVDSPSRRCQ